MLQTRFLLTINLQCILFSMPIDFEVTISHDEELFRVVMLVIYNLISSIILALAFFNELDYLFVS